MYVHHEAFFDVVEGENTGAGDEGLKATKGWDPATGMGTPNFPKLAALGSCLV